LEAKGDYAEAEPLYRRALAIAEKAQGPEHPDTGISLSNLAVLLEAKGDYAGAEPYYRRVLAIAEKAGDREEAARLLQNNAVMIRNAGKPGRALPDLQKALAIQQELHGDNSLEAASSMNALGQCLLMLEDKPSALKMFEACLRIRRNLLPADDPSIGLVEVRIASIEK
jgi:tetratricopeptide (TPR) repeat protein